MSAKRYTGQRVDITFDAERCIHSAACVRGAPEVFAPDRRPWILPDEAGEVDALVAVVQRCPTGALHAERHDGGPVDETDGGPTRVTVLPGGPLALRGRITVRSAEPAAAELHDTRMALCRCGQTGTAPLCDGSHADLPDRDGSSADGFTDPGRLPDELPDGQVLVDPGAEVLVRARQGGPLKLAGPVEVTGSDGRVWRGTDCVLCRCGLSASKPFCDGSHRTLRTTTDRTEAGG